MKNLFIATLIITSLAAFVPTAGACDHKKKKYYADRYDYRPSYGYYQAPTVYYRPAPVVHYRSDDYENCRPAYRTNHRPALSFLFGF